MGLYTIIHNGVYTLVYMYTENGLCDFLYAYQGLRNVQDFG